MENYFSRNSLKHLETCHHDLKVLAYEVLKIHDCTVVCGYRDKEEQDFAFNEGFSTVEWPNSKHNSFPANAIDLGPYLKGQSLYDREQTLYFAGIVMGIASRLYSEGKMKHKLKWGGDWDRDNNFKEHSFYDGIHFELIDV